MKQKVKQQFLNLKFQNKIIGISLVIGLIPIVLLGFFSYSKVYSLLIEREETALRETLHREVMQLEYKLNSYLTTMNLIVWNENIRLALAKDYTSNYEMYLTYRDTIDPLFLTTRSLNSDITSITIYTDAHIYPHDNTLRPLTEAQNKQWYEKACQTTVPFFCISENGKTLNLICQMYYHYVPYTNIICMSIDLNSALAAAESLFESNYGFVLLNDSKETIYQYTELINTDTIAVSRDLWTDKLPGYITKTETLTPSGWTALLSRPVRTVTAAANNITYIALCMVFMCILLILFVSSKLSKVIVSPIIQLSANMEQVEQGNYALSVSSESTDEVGQLITSFQKMVHTLNNLVNEVLLSKIRQQKYEIEILQSQINPHFLYNSLSLINSKAIMSGQHDISQMARLLSTFYRTMLNKGQPITTIGSELENTKSYISIQQMMHAQSFDVVYDIDSQVLAYPIPSLLLQPLAENAIIHGLDQRELPSPAILSFSCGQEKEDIIFKIMDNGWGMAAEECEKILTKDSKGYGVKNVHQRIQLYYGSEYGLTYHSTKNMGTYVILRIRKNIQNQEITSENLLF